MQLLDIQYFSQVAGGGEVLQYCFYASVVTYPFAMIYAFHPNGMIPTPTLLHRWALFEMGGIAVGAALGYFVAERQEKNDAI